MPVFEKQTLGNGIRLVTATMPRIASTVSCFVTVGAGSRYETPESKGIAHFVERTCSSRDGAAPDGADDLHRDRRDRR